MNLQTFVFTKPGLKIRNTVGLFHARVVLIPVLVLENACDTAKNAGIDIGSLFIHPIPCHLFAAQQYQATSQLGYLV